MQRFKARILLFIKYFFEDFLMLTILLLNIFWILFDELFSILSVQQFFLHNVYDFYLFYFPLHQNFTLIDLCFVAVYIIELIIKAFWEKRKRKYPRFINYFLSHWYDVLGCMPVGVFVWLRLLRIVSVLVKLDKMKIIDLSKNFFVRKFVKYYNIILEEISHRVVLNVLNGIKEEFQQGKPVINDIIDKVESKGSNDLIKLFVNRALMSASQEYSVVRNDFQKYVFQKSINAVNNNSELQKLGSIPVLGPSFINILQRSIAKTSFETVDGIISDATSSRGEKFFEKISRQTLNAVVTDFKSDFNSVVSQIVVSAIEIVEAKVKVKQWKLKIIDEEIENLKNRDSDNARKTIDELLLIRQREVDGSK